MKIKYSRKIKEKEYKGGQLKKKSTKHDYLNLKKDYGEIDTP